MRAMLSPAHAAEKRVARIRRALCSTEVLFRKIVSDPPMTI